MTFKDALKKFGEVGEVIAINGCVCDVSGLPSASFKEKLFFENGCFGEVLSLNENFVRVVLINGEAEVGLRVARSGVKIATKYSKSFFGSVIDPLGNVIFSKSKNKPTDFINLELDKEPPPLLERAIVEEQFLSGFTSVDCLVPIGKGQREVVLGEQKTGKTSFLLSLANSSSKNGLKTIYCLIGSKIEEVKKVYEMAIKEDFAKDCIFIVSFADSQPGTILLTPFTGMAISEYLRDQGQDVLLIMDSLSNHAKYYREVSLFSKKFPGRDSYPGDIFYYHSRLLERAGCFNVNGKKVSITCFPVCVNLGGELFDYITSNLIGITDGHLFFDPSIFAKGTRPPISVLLSVTRLGRQVQVPLLQQIGLAVTSFITKDYQESSNLSHFGTELNDSIRKTIDKGDKIFRFLTQGEFEYVPVLIQAFFLYAILCDFFGAESSERLIYYRGNVVKNYENNTVKAMFKDAFNCLDLDDFFKHLNDNKVNILKICQSTKK